MKTLRKITAIALIFCLTIPMLATAQPTQNDNIDLEYIFDLGGSDLVNGIDYVGFVFRLREGVEFCAEAHENVRMIRLSWADIFVVDTLDDILLLIEGGYLALDDIYRITRNYAFHTMPPYLDLEYIFDLGGSDFVNGVDYNGYAFSFSAFNGGADFCANAERHETVRRVGDMRLFIVRALDDIRELITRGYLTLEGQDAVHVYRNHLIFPGPPPIYGVEDDLFTSGGRGLVNGEDYHGYAFSLWSDVVFHSEEHEGTRDIWKNIGLFAAETLDVIRLLIAEGYLTLEDFRFIERNYVLRPEPPMPPRFDDVPSDHWAYDHIKHAARNGFMAGVSTTHFAPDDTMTRAMFVQMIHNMEENPPVDLEAYRGTFMDVLPGDWFEEAVLWSFSGGLTHGFTGQFDPDGVLNRAMLATLFRNYAMFMGQYEPVPAGVDPLAVFPDVEDVPNWATDSMAWAVYHGLISGVPLEGMNHLQPDGSTTRAQAAAILQNFIMGIR